MSPLNQNLEDLQEEQGDQLAPQVSDMRRVSLSLAFSPARQRRRSKMAGAGGWLKNNLGIDLRRALR